MYLFIIYKENASENPVSSKIYLVLINSNVVLIPDRISISDYGLVYMSPLS